MPVTAPHTRPMTTYAYPSERPGRLHILIVDEDAAVRSACCEIAARRGFTPHAVENLATARSLLHGNSVDILLLDLARQGPASNWWKRSRCCTRRWQ